MVNTTLLKISLTLVKYSLEFFIRQKRELLGGRDDDDEDLENDEENENEEDEPLPPRHPKSRCKSTIDILYSLQFQNFTKCFRNCE